MTRTITVSKATAVAAIEYLKRFGTLRAAAHQIDVQLTAIRPYTSRDLSHASELLYQIARMEESNPAAAERARLQLGKIAGEFLTADKRKAVQ